MSKENGSFLIRFSSTRGCLALSTLTLAGVMHCRLVTKRSPTGMSVILDENTYMNLDHLIESSSDSLTSPCDRKVDQIKKE
jgi:hypothetical protein